MRIAPSRTIIGPDFKAVSVAEYEYLNIDSQYRPSSRSGKLHKKD